MKVVILAGGLGTRLSEETYVRPKPMVEIGDKPMLWHIMKIYSHFGFDDFVICLGYKGYMVKEYFNHYILHNCDVTFDLSQDDQAERMRLHQRAAEPWKVTLVDTGADTQTGGRLKRVAPHLDAQTFMMTYGDGVADIDVRALVEHHRAGGRLATVTAVQPAGRFGAMDVSGDGVVTSFHEKPSGESGWINGGFFVLEPAVIDYIDSDETKWEDEPLEDLAAAGQLDAYLHRGFWQPMDTLRERHELEQMWVDGDAPWRVW